MNLSSDAFLMHAQICSVSKGFIVSWLVINRKQLFYYYYYLSKIPLAVDAEKRPKHDVEFEQNMNSERPSWRMMMSF
jgi:hypothetical protein